jgi:hypothetical protein
MITVNANQKILTCAEVATFTDICDRHLQNLVKRLRLGSILRTGTLKIPVEQWLLTSHDSRLNPVNGRLEP